MQLGHLNALRALEAAVRLGSFRAAGEELGVTPAAVGQQVKKLEEAYGARLLERLPNGIAPTRLARQVTEHLTPGFEQLRDGVSLLQKPKAGVRLSLSANPTIAENWIAPRLPDFWRRHPEVDLQLDSTHQVHFRAGDNFDFAMRYAPSSPDAVRQYDLFREWLVPVCVPEIAVRVNLENRDRTFADAPLLHVGSETSDSEWLDWEGWAARFGFDITETQPSLKFTHTTMALRSLYEGHGVLLAQLSITLGAIVAGRLVAPFGADFCVNTGYPYRLVYFGPERMHRLHAEFVDWIGEQSDRTAKDMAGYLGLQSD